ncbi:MAG: hypothetical protein AAGJ34_03205 [Pseudomonadota bacterium]
MLDRKSERSYEPAPEDGLTRSELDRRELARAYTALLKELAESDPCLNFGVAQRELWNLTVHQAPKFKKPYEPAPPSVEQDVVVPQKPLTTSSENTAPAKVNLRDRRNTIIFGFRLVATAFLTYVLVRSILWLM